MKHLYDPEDPLNLPFHRHHGIDFAGPEYCPYCVLEEFGERVLVPGNWSCDEPMTLRSIKKYVLALPAEIDLARRGSHSELLLSIRWWQENPTLRLNPYVQVPLGGPQSAEFWAWQEGAMAAIERLGELLGEREDDEKL